MECQPLYKEAFEFNNVIDEWIYHSRDIVKSYLENGEHPALDKYFKEVTPDFKGIVYRVGMISKEAVNNLKKGDIVTNSFPFATSYNNEVTEVFSRLTDNRLVNRPTHTKIRYRILLNTPQYKLPNKAESEVLIKPKVKFIIEDIFNADKELIVSLRAPEFYGRLGKAIPLLGIEPIITTKDK